jgi:hypothetical protein
VSFPRKRRFDGLTILSESRRRIQAHFCWTHAFAGETKGRSFHNDIFFNSATLYTAFLFHFQQLNYQLAVYNAERRYSSETSVFYKILMGRCWQIVFT